MVGDELPVKEMEKQSQEGATGQMVMACQRTSLEECLKPASPLKSHEKLEHLFSKYVLVAYCVPLTNLGTGNSVVSKTETPAFMESTFWWGRQETNVY